jgi:hypothetical protein
MTIIDEDELIFSGRHGERIAVTVRSTMPNPLVDFDLDGQKGVLPSTGPQSRALSLTLDRNGNNPTMLTLTFHFVSPAGGELYRLNVEGDPGTASFETDIPQLNSKVTAAFLTFNVV